MDYKDIATRAAKTFAQAFFATLAASVIGIVDIETAKAAVIAAGAAGISAAWNAVVNYRSGK